MKRTIEAEFLMIATAIALLAGGVACASSKASQTASAGKRSAGKAVLHTGRQSKDGPLSLLARALLPSSAKTHSGFAYYGYLIFTDTSPSSAFARRTASKFTLGMLDRINAAKNNPRIQRESMAVLYVPVNDGAAADTLIREQDAQALVAAYDYTRARAISTQLKRAGKTIPGVAIVGSTRPLTTGEEPDTIDVVDLTDPGTVAERMEKFRNALETREHPVGEDAVLSRLRAFFAWAETAEGDGSMQLSF